jgi:hypothetical protein
MKKSEARIRAVTSTMIAVVRSAYLTPGGIWQVAYDLPLAGVSAISGQVANSDAQARDQAAISLCAKGYQVFLR